MYSHTLAAWLSLAQRYHPPLAEPPADAVLHAGCVMLVECLVCSHGRVQSGCCAVVVTSSLPVMGMGRLRVTTIRYV